MVQVEPSADPARLTSFVDRLSELGTRELFLDRLTLALRRNVRDQGRRLAVLSLAVDQFATIETSIGYDAAHEVLAEFAHRLTLALRDVDSVARLSGAEFGILLESLRDESDAARVAQRVHEALRRPVRTSGGDFVVSASVGVALGAGGDSPGRLLQLAALARDRTRGSGAPYELSDPDMQRRAERRLRDEMDLRRAVEAGDFEVHYQPVVALPGARIVHLEALVRWRHPERGLVAAAEFMPLAERAALDIPIGWLVLHESCRQLREWRDRLPSSRPMSVSVNISAPHLRHPELGDRLAAALREYRLPRGSLNVEITEGSVIEDPEQARVVLRALRAIGVRVHLDDFGSGYSLLSCLHELPLDVIKIDRSFIAQLVPPSPAARIATTLRELARHIGAPVVAEGVESAEHFAAVRALGCDYAQGFLFSPAVTAQAVTEFIARGEAFRPGGGSFGPVVPAPMLSSAFERPAPAPGLS